jgi:hypothetical protein
MRGTTVVTGKSKLIFSHINARNYNPSVFMCIGLQEFVP